MNKKPNLYEPAPSAIRAYLGGSFNPVHDGHIQMAMQVYKTLSPLANAQLRPLLVSLLPNVRSPFKQKTVAPKHRLAMLKLAIKNTPLTLSELELWQTPPVYTIDSVRTLREQYPHDSLIFIMGMDSARSLDRWKHGLQLTDYVHLWVFERTDDLNIDAKQKVARQNSAYLDCNLPPALSVKVTDNPNDLMTLTQPPSSLSQPLKNSPQGRIYIDNTPIITVSSSQIRQQLKTADTCTYQSINHLDPAVYQYIITHQLYSAAQFR